MEVEVKVKAEAEVEAEAKTKAEADIDIQVETISSGCIRRGWLFIFCLEGVLCVVVCVGFISLSLFSLLISFSL